MQVIGRRVGHESLSSSSTFRSRMLSSASVTGDEITYPPLAHLPRSAVRHRGLQNGNSGSVLFTAFLQIGHWSLRLRLLGMEFFYQVSKWRGSRRSRRFLPPDHNRALR